MKPSQVTQGSHNGSAHSNSSCSPLSNSSSSSSGSYSIKIGGEEANKTLIDLRNNHLKSYMVVQRAREQSHKQNPNVYRQSQNIQPNLSTLADDSKMKSPDKQTGITNTLIHSPKATINCQIETDTKYTHQNTDFESSSIEFPKYSKFCLDPNSGKLRLVASTQSAPIRVNRQLKPKIFTNSMPPPSTNTNPMPQVHSAATGAKQLSKLKRFLTTLQQFASDISPEIGDRVRSLVLSLVNSGITIEEFHGRLQEATNFPLRPFVIPFLRANLPLLQRELLHFARMAKLNTSEYISQNVENILNYQEETSINHNQEQNNETDCVDSLNSDENNYNEQQEHTATLKRKATTDENMNYSLQHHHHHHQSQDNNNEIEFIAPSPIKQQRTTNNVNAKSHTNNITRMFNVVSPTTTLSSTSSNTTHMTTPSSNHLSPTQSQYSHQNQQGAFSFALPTPPTPSSHHNPHHHHHHHLTSMPINSSNSYFTPPLSSHLAPQHILNMNSQLYSHIQNQQNIIGSTTIADTSSSTIKHHHQQQQQQQQTPLANNFNAANNNNEIKHTTHYSSNQLQAVNKQQPHNSSQLHKALQESHYSPSSSSSSSSNKRITLSPTHINTTSSSSVQQQQQKSNQIKLEDIIVLREMKEKSFNIYMKDFEQEFDDTNQERFIEDDFKKIENSLSSIFEMVSRTKQMVNHLQLKTNRLRSQVENYENQLKRKSDYEMNDERIEEIKKKAEHSINEVKRQAHIEMQRAVIASENKASEVLKKERERHEKSLEEIKRKFSKENASVRQEDNFLENCWNCGRKATETCSGCKKAKYCSEFCQHKHWEILHHKLCSSMNTSIINTLAISPSIRQSEIDVSKKKLPEKETTENTLGPEKVNENEGEENSKGSSKNETHSSKEDLKNTSTDSEDRFSQSGYEEHNELQVIDDNDYEKNLKNSTSQLLNTSNSSTKSNSSLSHMCKIETV